MNVAPLAGKIHNYPLFLFRLVCRLVGAYVFYYSLILIPSGTYLYSHAGSLPNYTFNNVPIWAGIFNIYDSPVAIFIGLCALSLLGLALVIGFQSMWIPLSAWALYASFQNRNVLTENPSTDIIGFLLLFIFLLFLARRILPETENVRTHTIHMPAILYEGTWIMVGLAFSASGIARIRGESWFGGMGIADIFSVMPVRDNALSQGLQTIITSLPDTTLISITAFVTFLFVFAFPLSLFKETRPYLLSSLMAMYFVVVLIADMSQIVFAVLILFLLLADVLYPHAETLLRTISSLILSTFRYRFFWSK